MNFPIFTIKDDDDLFQAKPVEKEKPTKPVGANVLFNPAALKNSNLFKKLAVQSKTSDDEEEKRNDEELSAKSREKQSQAKQITENIDNFFDSPLAVAPKASVSQEATPAQATNNEDNDLFASLKVDKAFSDSTFKSAQKVNII